MIVCLKKSKKLYYLWKSCNRNQGGCIFPLGSCYSAAFDKKYWNGFSDYFFNHSWKVEISNSPFLVFSRFAFASAHHIEKLS